MTNERDKEILTQWFGLIDSAESLDETGQSMNLTTKRVEQLRDRAISKLTSQNKQNDLIMAITFNTLNPDAKIFQELKKNPYWWTRFKKDSSLYIEIRKDNQVNVYFEGGSVARIHYCSKHKKLQVFTHHKYLDLPAPSKSNAYIECSDIIDKPIEKDSEILICDKVIERVKTCYSQKHAINGVVDKEKWSEKFIQGSLITKSLAFHLDSEFAYNDASEKIRIDIVQCDNGVITFVELKRIGDGRMLHKTDESPEIIDQMDRYKDFITKHTDELLTYYQKLYDVKAGLGLPVPQVRPISINPEPHLLIFDNWTKETSRRKIHRERLVDILNRKHIMDKTPLVYLFERTDFNNVKELDCPLFPGLFD